MPKGSTAALKARIPERVTTVVRRRGRRKRKTSEDRRC
jgi:hypothetical protein